MEKITYRLIVAIEEIDETFEYYSDLIMALATTYDYLDVSKLNVFIICNYEKGRWAELERYATQADIDSFKFEEGQKRLSEMAHVASVRSYLTNQQL